MILTSRSSLRGRSCGSGFSWLGGLGSSFGRRRLVLLLASVLPELFEALLDLVDRVGC